MKEVTPLGEGELLAKLINPGTCTEEERTEKPSQSKKGAVLF